ncbi:hypothetical protein TWF481_001391 [Arthrobotrys musiformis]|uniref:AB hydrolase-1 domain-containing protein n=1 Tax=Arthrobotrys musiformis TaxID=47236 RepID=A0AAV9WRI1_9PEZI
MTLRTKLAAFHARIHSHRSTHHHFHLPHLRHKSSKDSKDKENDRSSSSSPSKKCAPKLPSPPHRNRDSLSSTASSTSLSGPPSPVLTLLLPVPSHQTHTIEARVYHPDFPSTYGLSRHTPRKAAVLAHPYAPLSGNWDDPVVLSLVSLLTKKGWVVATFNFCGAGNSKGKTSWTGTREKEEFAVVTGFLVRYVECIDPHTFTIPAATAGPAEGEVREKQPIKVLLAGYSYGSLIASRTPPASHVLKSLDVDILAYATRTAYEWASTEKRRSFAMTRGAAAGRSVWADCDDQDEQEGEQSGSRDVSAKVNYTVQSATESSWLLVSPLLPPVSMFLNIPNPLSWFHPANKNKEGEEEEEVEDERDVLAVYGTDDMFTGVGKYRTWVNGKVERSGGRFKGVEVDGASHFWAQEEEWTVKLKEAVSGWIDEKHPANSV